MRISIYDNFIKQNKAPLDAKRIGVYNSRGGKVGSFGLQNLNLPRLGRKCYSFLALSDSHIAGSTDTEDGTADFIRAVQYAENTDASFTCICGDVIDSGTEYLFGRFKTLKEKYTTKPLYVLSGNHETYPNGSVASATLETYFGSPLYYSFTQGDDVFIMLGEYGWTDNPPFADGELQFLYETLETNRNKRCFVFQHVFTFDDGDSGQPISSFYNHDIFTLDNNKETRINQKSCFINLLKHYKNTVWFHGHSHAKFQLQAEKETTVYSDLLGYKSVHIPSLAKPKDLVNGSVVTVTEESQGYVIDVYENGIHLRGRDFVKGEFLPIASYWLDTTVKSIESNAFADPTGTIVT